MPIRPDLKQYYGEHWDTVVRPRILERAENCCENCGKPNSRYVVTRTWKDAEGHYHMIWRWSISALWWDQHGHKFKDPLPLAYGRRPAAYQKTIFVVLTIAHLNHTSGDDRDENLRALCQWCHLHHDMAHHKDTRCERKDQARPILEVS